MLVVCAALLLSACSLPNLVYNRADFFVVREVGKYLTLTDAQKNALGAAVTDWQVWHRAHALPQWQSDTRALAADLQAPLEAAEITAWGQRVERHLRVALDEMMVRLVPLIATLSDAQIAEFWASFDERRAERRDDAPSDVDALAQQGIKSMRRWVGRPNDEQVALIVDWAVVVYLVPELPHVLDDHADPVRVALVQLAASGVVGAAASEPDRAVAHVLAPFSFGAEAVVLELEQRGEGEGVVGPRDVDVLGPETRVGPQDVLCVVPRDPGERAVLEVVVRAGFQAAADDRLDSGRDLLEVSRSLCAGHDEACRVVGLDATVQQVQWIDDRAALEDILRCDALVVVGLGVIRSAP